MPGTPILAAIFDMDGVLTDSEPLINAAAIAMFKEKGLTVHPADFLPFVGTGEDRYIGGVAEKYSFPLDMPEAKRRTYEIYLELVPEQLAAFPGAVDLVRACRAAGLRLAVASSADRIKVEANLRRIDLPPELWDAVITGEDVAAKKPAPDIFLHAASRIGITPEQCVVVEDAVNGVAAAKAAGMRCVAVAQSFSADKLAGADLVIPRIADTTVQLLLGAPPVTPPALPSPCLKGSEQAEAHGRAFWGAWATFGLGMAIGGGWMAAQAAVAMFFAAAVGMTGKGSDKTGLLLSVATLGSAPVAVVLSFAFARIRRGGMALTDLGFSPFEMKQLVRWTLALIAVIIGSDLLTHSLGRPVVPDFMHEMYASAGLVPLLWVAVVIAAPVAEETLFRGFLLAGWVPSRLGAWGSIILSSALWAAIHLQYDLYGIITIFGIGLLLGWARVKTGSVYLCIVLHGLMNLVATAEAALLK